MPKEANIQFVESIKTVFETVFKEYGFELEEKAIWNGAGEDTVKASKPDIELIYYLGHLPQFYTCSVGIRLSGQLAERATSLKYYYNMSIIEIAHYLDKNYEYNNIDVYTNEDLIRALEQEKETLLTYCAGILSGDVSTWSEAVKRSEEYRTGSGKELWSIS
ncbi:MAG: hypothetical protein U0Z26_04990 [Anaerolineales bacterium]